jgi:hypothetical protein
MKIEFKDNIDKTSFVMSINGEPKCEFTSYGDGMVGITDLNGELFESETLEKQYMEMLGEQIHLKNYKL